MSIETSFGEIRSLFNAQQPPRESWEKLVAIFDACPEQDLDALLAQAGVYCEDHIKKWPFYERRFLAAPTHWIDQWLKGSAQHKKLLGLVPAGHRKTYYQIGYDSVTMLSNNGDGYNIQYTAYQNTVDGVRRSTEWEKDHYLEYAWDFAQWLYPDAEFYSLFNGDYPSTIELVFLDHVVARFEGIPDITFKHPDFEITLQPAHLPDELWRVLDAEGQIIQEAPKRTLWELHGYLESLEYDGREGRPTNHEIVCSSERFYKILPELPKAGLLTREDKAPKVEFWPRLWSRYVGEESFNRLRGDLEDFYFFRYGYHPRDLFSSRDMDAYRRVSMGHSYPIEIIEELMFAAEEFEVIDAPEIRGQKIPETDFGEVWLKAVDQILTLEGGETNFEDETTWEQIAEQINGQSIPSWMPEPLRQLPDDFDDWDYTQWMRASWCWAPMIESPLVWETADGSWANLYIRYQDDQLSIGGHHEGMPSGAGYGWSWYLADQLITHIQALLAPDGEAQ